MPKLKFSNSAESTPEVYVLPCRHLRNEIFITSGTSTRVEYQFDKHSDSLPLYVGGFVWLSPDDIDDLTAFFKAAKKRIEKNARKALLD